MASWNSSTTVTAAPSCCDRPWSGCGTRWPKISKKNQETIDARRLDFLKGAQERGVSEATAKEIFDLICYFGGYGFNKSQSTAYAKLGYQTAYLKAHYTPEFMAALLTSEIEDSNKRDIMVEHIEDARRLGVEVLPPNIQEGEANFTVKDGKIVFGLLAVKGVGRGAVDTVVRARAEKGPFRDFYDFCERVDHKALPKSALERLIKVGAFDCLGARRRQLLETMPRAIAAVEETQRDRRLGQLNLFESLDNGDGAEAAPAVLPDVPEWMSGGVPEWHDSSNCSLCGNAELVKPPALCRGSLGWLLPSHPTPRARSPRPSMAPVARLL
jgi:DNA polymerase III subunit alpha